MNPAKISGMPETTLSEPEWQKCKELLTFMVGDLWTTYLFDKDTDLLPNQANAAYEALERFTGKGKDYPSKWKLNELTYKDQEDIDKATKAFTIQYSSM